VKRLWRARGVYIYANLATRLTWLVVGEELRMRSTGWLGRPELRGDAFFFT
jgi:hypothetical protein